MNNAITHDLSYLVSAEYYDIMSELHWEKREAELKSLLVNLKCKAKVIIDVGSGSGKSLPLINNLFPDGHIHAIEPSRAMRIALMTRVMSNTALRNNVSIYPTTVDNLTFKRAGRHYYSLWLPRIFNTARALSLLEASFIYTGTWRTLDSRYNGHLLTYEG